MEARKLQLVGNTSYSVSLPKAWIEKNKLDKQHHVYISETGNNELVVRLQQNKEEQTRSITISLDSVENVAQFVVFCYAKNINTIRLTSKAVNYEQAKEVRAVIRYLEGYEITSDTEKEIEISFVFNDVNITVKKLMQRILYLLKTQVTALEKKELQTLEETEYAIDRLYHLSKRVLFACLHNHAMREANDIVNEEDLFYLKDIMNRLEGFGDKLYDLKDAEYTAHDLETCTRLIHAAEELALRRKKEAVQHLKLSMSADPDTRLILGQLHHLCMEIFEKVVSIEFDRKYF
jgi:phosphate uptake regulator